MSFLRDKRLYHIPKLSAIDLGLIRSPGPGLGNLLFPISRALIGQAKLGGEFVFPTMLQVKFGPIFRRERDWRTYGGVLRQRNIEDWRCWFAASFVKKFDEADDFPDNKEQMNNVGIVYAGLGNLFHDIVDYREMIRGWLVEHSAKRQEFCEAYDIALHVRLGDFAIDKADEESSHNIRVELAWYRNAYLKAAQMLSLESPTVRLFTDGNALEVAKELAIPNMTIDPGNCALVSILNLSNAHAVITSRSSFSMWGTFLGNSIAYWDKRFDYKKSFPTRIGLDFDV